MGEDWLNRTWKGLWFVRDLGNCERIDIVAVVSDQLRALSVL